MSAFTNEKGQLRVPPTHLIHELTPQQLDQLDQLITQASIDTRQQIAWLQSEGRDTAAAGQALSHFERGKAAIAATRGHTWTFNSRHPLDQLDGQRITLNRLLDVYNAAQHWYQLWNMEDDSVDTLGIQVWEEQYEESMEVLAAAVIVAQQFFKGEL